MADHNFRKIPKEDQAKGNINEAFQTNVYLTNTNRVLPLSELSFVLDVNDQFDRERISNFCYRVSATIREFPTNVLVDVEEHEGLLFTRDVPPNEYRIEYSFTIEDFEFFGNGFGPLATSAVFKNGTIIVDSQSFGVILNAVSSYTHPEFTTELVDGDELRLGFDDGGGGGFEIKISSANWKITKIIDDTIVLDTNRDSDYTINSISDPPFIQFTNTPTVFGNFTNVVYTLSDNTPTTISGISGITEQNGWFIEDSTGEFLSPTPDQLNIINSSNETNNWRFLVRYPSEINNQDLEINGLSITEGIRVVQVDEVTLSNRSMLQITTAMNHGMSPGDTFVVRNTPGGLFTAETLTVYTVGDYTGAENIKGRNEEFNIVVDISPPNNADVIFNTATLRRVFDGVESQYYSRWFRVMAFVEQAEIFKTGFSRTTFDDNVTSLLFNTSFDVRDLVDHLGRPLTELFVSITKNTILGFYTEIKSGVLTNNSPHLNILDISDNTASPTPIESFNTAPPLMFGDIVEYNALEQSEKVLMDAYHRFNLTNRLDRDYFEGYYYKPHHRVQIRNISEIVSIDTLTGGTEDDVPDYAVDLGDGRIAWRNILDNGEIEDTNVDVTYPFLNGCHYTYNNINHYLRRQDPERINPLLLGNPNPISGVVDDFTDLEENDFIDEC